MSRRISPKLLADLKAMAARNRATAGGMFVQVGDVTYLYPSDGSGGWYTITDRGIVRRTMTGEERPPTDVELDYLQRLLV